MKMVILETKMVYVQKGDNICASVGLNTIGFYSGGRIFPENRQKQNLDVSPHYMLFKSDPLVYTSYIPNFFTEWKG